MIALTAAASSFAYAAGTNDVNFQVMPMGQFTSVTVSENGQALANTPITVKGKTTSEVYTTNADGTVYLSNVTHANKQYTLQVTDKAGQSVNQNTFIRSSSSNT